MNDRIKLCFCFCFNFMKGGGVKSQIIFPFGTSISEQCVRWPLLTIINQISRKSFKFTFLIFYVK